MTGCRVGLTSPPAGFPLLIGAVCENLSVGVVMIKPLMLKSRLYEKLQKYKIGFWCAHDFRVFGTHEDGGRPSGADAYDF